MTIDRRQLMTSAAIAGVAAALPFGARTVHAQALGRAQAPAFQRMKVGETLVTAVSDGHLTLGAQVFPNVSEEEFEAALRNGFLDATGGGYAAPVNAYLVERGGEVMLIDAGGTSAMAPTLGNLGENLGAAGVAAGDVGTILLTHLHPDHIGGLMSDGAAAFPAAELVVRAEEFAFWTDPATRDMLPEAQRGMVDNVMATAKAYEGRITRFEDDVEVVSGITARFLPGHTPGHTGYLIADGAETLMVWGDIVHVAPVQLPQPQRFIGFDTDPDTAVSTRRAILDEVSADRTRIAGMHLPFPGVGHIAKDGEGYGFVRADWQYEL